MAAYFRLRWVTYVEALLQRLSKARLEVEKEKSRQRLRKECDGLFDKAIVDSAAKGKIGVDSKVLRSLIEGHVTKGDDYPLHPDMQVILDLVFAAGVALDRDKIFEVVRLLHTIRE